LKGDDRTALTRRDDENGFLSLACLALFARSSYNKRPERTRRTRASYGRAVNRSVRGGRRQSNHDRGATYRFRMLNARQETGTAVSTPPISGRPPSYAVLPLTEEKPHCDQAFFVNQRHEDQPSFGFDSVNTDDIR